MSSIFNKTRILVSCLAISMLAHMLVVYALKMFGTYDFTAPVNPLQGVMVDLTKTSETASPAVTSEKQEDNGTEHDEEDVHVEKQSAPSREEENSTPPSNLLKHQPESDTTHTSAAGTVKTDSPVRNSEADHAAVPDKLHQPLIANAGLPPLRAVSEFLSNTNEKLTYIISMFGIPVGSAELEAKNENGETWITLRVKSNAAISSIFPVDDSIETRHIDGKFIMTKIKQQEGSFKGDTGFTINLRKKSVSWDDYIRNRSMKLTLPTDEILDTLSGFYYLRNRPLQIGKTEDLHIFDSETYADVPVEILRRETIRLPNLKNIDTLVVRPLQKTEGIFRRSGDILIWMTDDAHKVPVKIVTSIALGTVSVDLVSAESTSPVEEIKKK